ncbi:MAG: PD40 domain-containing protein [Acidobacteria bacterium]|nr:PD40 domain-containing protein [Acidobacteriota bacterium]
MALTKSASQSTKQSQTHAAAWRFAVVSLLAICWFNATITVFAQRPELAIQTGHSARVNAVAYSPNGRIIASGGVDQTIKLWDVETGLELRTLRGHTAAVQALAFSPDGRLLASGGTDNIINLWDVQSGRVERTLEGHQMTVTSLAFSADGKTLASGGMDQAIRVWEVATGRQRRSWTTDDKAVYQGLVLMALSPDGRTVISGGEITKLWDANIGYERRTLVARNPSGAPPDRAITLSPDGKTLAISGKVISLMDVATGQVRWASKPGEYVGIESLAFSPDGKTLVGGGVEITFWDAATGRQIRQLPRMSDYFRVIYSPDGRFLLASGGSTREIALRLLDAETGEEIRKFMGHTGPITSVAFSTDGRTLASGRQLSLARTDTVKLWDLTTGQILRTLSGNRNAVRDVAFSGDGRTLASGGGIEFRIWDATTGKLIREVNGNPRQVDVLAYSPDGKILATGDRNGTIQLWDATTGQPTRLLKGHSEERFGSVRALAFHPDGKTLASGGRDKAVRLWDAATGQEVRTLSGHTNDVSAVAFSPDGRVLASSGIYQQLNLWDSQSGQLLRTLPTFPQSTSFRINSLAFSPNGKLLTAGVIPLLNEVGGVLVWDVVTGKLLHQLTGTSGVSSVAFSPDSRLIAAGNHDTTVGLWEAETGKLLANLLALDGQDWLVVTPDGLFDGSPTAWSQILWRFSPQLYDVAPVEQFFNEYYYPGLLSELVSGKRPRAAINIEQKDRRQPQLKLSVGDGIAANAAISRRVKVKLDITEAPAGAQDVRLFRNGSLVKVWRGDALNGRLRATLETEIPIAAGANRLTAYAFNRDNVKSADATLTINGAESLKRAGTAYLLAVGVNQYANPEFNLRFAVADATDFATELQRQQEKLNRYERVELVSLNDQQATKAAILKALADIAAKAQPEDAVVVYFAGHGTAEQNQFYLIPHDLGYRGARNQLTAASVKLVLSRSISDRDLERAFEAINAEQLLLVIDACNSGQALEAAEKRRGPMNSKGLAQLAYEKGMYVLTASQSYQAAIEPADLKHGLLTYTLIEEGLKGAAADAEPKDGTILLREWLDYASERVPQLQRERMKEAEKRRFVLSYVEGEERRLKAEDRNVQRPRVFYRRELESQPFVILGTKQ